MNFLTEDSWLGRFFSLVGDIVTMHVLWLLCSLPLITIGASTTALYYCLMKRIRRNEGYITQSFFRSFKENFRQSTILWIGMILTGLILWIDIQIGMNTAGILGKSMLIASSMLLIPFLLIIMFIFPVQAKFDNPLFQNIKNALIIALANPGCTLILLFITATFLLMILFSRAFLGLFLLCGVGLYGYLTSNLFVFIFRKYLPAELDEDIEAFGMKK